MPSRKFVIDAAERLGWQVAYAGLSTGIVEVSHLNYSWVPILILGLNCVKVLVAQHVGDSNNAAIGGSTDKGATA